MWVSGFAAGAVNAVAGGGTLITFPTLIALGVPPLIANVSNTVALCPGFLGATYVQRRDLQPQRRRIVVLVPLAAVGGIVGAYVLRHTSAGAFDQLAPFLVLAAVALLALGPYVKRRAVKRAQLQNVAAQHADRLGIAAVTTLAVAVYGGYFGAGMSVMIIAVLSVVLTDQLVRITALKQLLALVINGAAASYLLITNGHSGLIAWPVVAAVGTAAVVGGVVGGRLSQRVNEVTLRWLVIGIGVVFAAVYWLG
jgi:uncharacterized protein